MNTICTECGSGEATHVFQSMNFPLGTSCTVEVTDVPKIQCPRCRHVSIEASAFATIQKAQRRLKGELKKQEIPLPAILRVRFGCLDAFILNPSKHNL